MLISKKKQTWANQFKPNMIKGGVLRHNVALQSRYAAKLEAMVAEMQRQTIKELTKLSKTPDAQEFFAMDASIASQSRILLSTLSQKFDEIFGDASKLAAGFIKQIYKTSKSALAGSLKEMSGGLTVKTDVMGADLTEIFKASVTENTNLIKSIPEQYIKSITGAVTRSITSGQGLEDLIPAIERIGGVTNRRAKIIALDQTRKAYSAINSARMQKVGIEEFEWIHSGGGLNPRRDHMEMSGNIYRFDDLPVIDKKTGERGLPGQAPNCRCTMRPVLKLR